MRLLTFHIVQAVIVFLIGFVILAGCDNRIGGNIDFPCGYYGEGYYNPKLQCYSQRNGENSGVRIEYVLDYHRAFWSGIACNHGSTITNELSLDDVKLERVDDRLNVDGQELAKGKEFARVDWLYPDLWIDSYVRFTNYGLVSNCGQGRDTERIMIIGEGGTQPSFKGLFLIFLLVVAFVLNRRNLKK